MSDDPEIAAAVAETLRAKRRAYYQANKEKWRTYDATKKAKKLAAEKAQP